MTKVQLRKPVAGAHASNVCAEAAPPKASLYVKIDQLFNDWWVNVKQQKLILLCYVLQVQRALQGHPESPRLCSDHINNILQKELGF